MFTDPAAGLYGQNIYYGIETRELCKYVRLKFSAECVGLRMAKCGLGNHKYEIIFAKRLRTR
jgi:hypothetical protein